MAIKNALLYILSTLPIFPLFILIYLLLKKVNATDFMWLMFWLYIIIQSFQWARCFWTNLVYEE